MGLLDLLAASVAAIKDVDLASVAGDLPGGASSVAPWLGVNACDTCDWRWGVKGP